MCCVAKHLKNYKQKQQERLHEELYIYIKICLFVYDCAGSSLLCRLSLAAASRGYCLAVVHGLLIAIASLVAQHGT